MVNRFYGFSFWVSLRLLVLISWHYFSHFWRIFKGGINFKTVCVRLILIRWLLKGFQKQDLLCVSVTTLFGVNNFRNTYTMRFNSFLNWSKFDVTSKNAKRWQKVFGFLDDYIWTGNGKLSLLWWEYSSLAVSVLKKRDLTALPSRDGKLTSDMNFILAS